MIKVRLVGNVQNFKMAFIIIFKSYYFQIAIKNLTKCNILNTISFKNFDKFVNHNSEKMYLVLGIDHFCPWP